jgi:hypothetical protein
MQVSKQISRGMLLLAASASLSVLAAGPRYRLVNGKGYTVCEAFLKNLNAFPATERPMICEQKIHPTHLEFSLPKWEVMDVQSNLKIIYAAESQIVELYDRPGEVKPSYDKWAAAFQERIKSKSATPILRKTVVTLNSRGPETVISYSPISNRCQSDVDIYREVVNGPDDYVFVLRAGSTPMVERVHHLPINVLFHHNKPYFVWAASQDFKTWGIRLYSVSPVLPALSGTNNYGLQFRCEIRVAK